MLLVLGVVLAHSGVSCRIMVVPCGISWRILAFVGEVVFEALAHSDARNTRMRRDTPGCARTKSNTSSMRHNASDEDRKTMMRTIAPEGNAPETYV